MAVILLLPDITVPQAVVALVRSETTLGTLAAEAAGLEQPLQSLEPL
jgi:hypothetical protein